MDFFDDYDASNTSNTEVQSEQPKAQTSDVLYSVPIVSQEQQVRKDRLKLLEDERIKQVKEREENERKLQKEKRDKAKQYLADWKDGQDKSLLSRKQQNRNKQELLLEAKKTSTEYKNTWDKVVQNIVLKDGEYPGQKDVSKMRQALLNKRTDTNK